MSPNQINHAVHELDQVFKAFVPMDASRDEVLRSVMFALSYYSEPDLYLEPVLPGAPILDGGLRARAALEAMRNSIRQVRHQTATKEYYDE